jgi:hypothetical protein
MFATLTVPRTFDLIIQYSTIRANHWAAVVLLSDNDHIM